MHTFFKEVWNIWRIWIWDIFVGFGENIIHIWNCIIYNIKTLDHLYTLNDRQRQVLCLIQLIFKRKVWLQLYWPTYDVRDIMCKYMWQTNLYSLFGYKANYMLIQTKNKKNIGISRMSLGHEEMLGEIL